MKNKNTKSDFFSKSGKTRFLKKGGVPPVGSVRGGPPPKSAALSSVWIGANYVKSDMVPIRNTTLKKKSEIWEGGINSDFSSTFDHFRHDFNDFRKKWNFEKSEKKCAQKKNL